MTNCNPFVVLARLVVLLGSSGRHDAAVEIGNILCDMMECQEAGPQETDDAAAAANLVGLQEGAIPEQPVGFLAVEPFFFDHSSDSG